MRRYHSELHIIERNHKERLRMAGPSDGKFRQAGRYRKRDAYDCGKPGCQRCHWTKIHQIKTPKQIVADISYREQLREVA